MSGADIPLPGWPAHRPPPRIAAVMQPYFLPYPGYCALMKHVDVFILDDLAQYTPKRWMNRNRLRTPDGGWQYFTLPVAHAPARTPICQIQIAPENWKCRLLGRLTAYACAPNYAVVCCLLKDFVQSDIALLNVLNEHALRMIADYLNIDTPIYLLSRLNLPGYCPPYPKGENALAVCRALGTVEEYCNPPGGSAFYPRQPYREAGIRLRFLEWQPPQAPPGSWQPMLSVLDGMMWLSPGQLAQSLQNFRLFE